MKCFYGLIGESGNALFEMVYRFFLLCDSRESGGTGEH